MPTETMLVIPVFIPHRGCPHQCSFCNQHHIANENTGTGDLAEIGQTIVRWLDRSPERRPVQVAFYGGSFTCLPQELQAEMLGVVQPFLESGAVAGIRLSTRPDCVDEAVCRLLMKYGVTVVELGIQSLTDSVLHAAQRGHTALQGKKAFHFLVEHGFEVGLQLMPGLPGESRRSFLRVVDEVVAMRPSFVRLYPAVVIKDSEMERLYRAGGYRPLSIDQAVLLTARSCAKLEGAGIRVVRIGLQPTDTLADKVVAGPYHPALGEMVRSRIWLHQLRRRLAELPPGNFMEITVSHRDISAVVGTRKRNIERLNALGFAGRFAVRADRQIPKGQVHYAVS